MRKISAFEFNFGRNRSIIVAEPSNDFEHGNWTKRVITSRKNTPEERRRQRREWKKKKQGQKKKSSKMKLTVA